MPGPASRVTTISPPHLSLASALHITEQQHRVLAAAFSPPPPLDSTPLSCLLHANDAYCPPLNAYIPPRSPCALRSGRCRSGRRCSTASIIPSSSGRCYRCSHEQPPIAASSAYADGGSGRGAHAFVVARLDQRPARCSHMMPAPLALPTSRLGSLSTYATPTSTTPHLLTPTHASLAQGWTARASLRRLRDLLDMLPKQPCCCDPAHVHELQKLPRPAVPKTASGGGVHGASCPAVARSVLRPSARPSARSSARPRAREEEVQRRDNCRCCPRTWWDCVRFCWYCSYRRDCAGEEEGWG